MTDGVLITGGAGFIGSHAAEALLGAGETVHVLDDFSTGRRENLAGLCGALEVVEGDVRDPKTVAAALRGCDRVLHLAAIASVARSFDDPATTEAVNVGGTANVLAAAAGAGARRVVLASSCAVYGAAGELPIAETAPTRPESPYARLEARRRGPVPGRLRPRRTRCRCAALLQRLRPPAGPFVRLLGRDRDLHGTDLWRSALHGVRRRAPDPRLRLCRRRGGRLSRGPGRAAARGPAGQHRHGCRDQRGRRAGGARRGHRTGARRALRGRPRRRHPALPRRLRPGRRVARLPLHGDVRRRSGARPGPGMPRSARRRPAWPARHRLHSSRRAEGRGEQQATDPRGRACRSAAARRSSCNR